jgi:hypothetical protein
MLLASPAFAGFDAEKIISPSLGPTSYTRIKYSGLNNDMGEPAMSDQNGVELPKWAVIGLWVVLIGCLIAEAIHRIWGGYVPRDLSAYLAAAQTFMAGGDPFTDDIKRAVSYKGYVYVYPPGTLPLIGPVSYLKQNVVATLDLFARATTLLGSLHWLKRRFSISAPLCLLVFLALLYEPILVDFRAANLPTYLLGAFLLCVHISHSPQKGWHLAAGALAGLALAFKPMWLAPTLLLFVVRRRWAALAAVVAGASVVGGLTLVHLEMVPTWLARIEQLAERYRNSVLINIHVAAWVSAVVVWLVGAVALVRKRGWNDELLWLWLCVSVVAWPRAGTYTYALYLPVFFFWWRRWDLRRAALAFVITLGPLPWMMRAFGYFGEYGWLQLAWGVVVAAVVFWQLWGQADEEFS